MEIVIAVAVIAVFVGIVLFAKRSSGGRSAPTRGSGGRRDGTYEQ